MDRKCSKKLGTYSLGISIVRKVCLNSEERRFVEDDPNRNANEAIFVLVRDKT